MTDYNIVAAEHPRWGQLASGELRPDFACLALKLMMIRVRHQFERQPDSRLALADEVRRFFVANMRFAAADYRNIFGEIAA